jgi:hypothetical protein
LAVVSLIALDAGLLTKADADAASAGDGAVDVADGVGLDKERFGARDEDW